MLPMYQSEAMWLNFDSPSGYPFAIRIAAGKIDAVVYSPCHCPLHLRRLRVLSRLESI